MQNLKIEVSTAEESKEAQELLLKLGYKDRKNWTKRNPPHESIQAWKDGEFTFSQNHNEVSVWFKEITLPELRAMVNQEQDEPFLTPETTLNEQYAEIEQVRQSLKDNVNHPSHYTQGKVECLDALESATIGKSGIEAVCVANVIKYLWRYEEKNGLEDIKKANFYLNRLIATLENNNG